MPDFDALPFTLQLPRAKPAVLLLISLVLVVTGAAMVWQRVPHGWFVLLCFLCGVPVFARQLWLARGSLRLHEEGFSFSGGARRTVAWADVRRFRVVGEGRGQRVAWTWREDAGRTRNRSTLPQNYGPHPTNLAVRMNTLRLRLGEPVGPPFFSVEELARLIAGEPVREPLPFWPHDHENTEAFYLRLIEELERAFDLRARVEHGHYGSGYASFLTAFFYPADGSAALPPFSDDEQRHVGLLVVFSRLSRFCVFLQDEQTWGSLTGSSGMPDFDGVDNIEHPALLPLLLPIEQRLRAVGIERLHRYDLSAWLPEEAAPPTLLGDKPFRQFDALYYWED